MTTLIQDLHTLEAILDAEQQGRGRDRLFVDLELLRRLVDAVWASSGFRRSIQLRSVLGPLEIV